MSALSEQLSKWLEGCIEAARQLSAVALSIEQVTLDGITSELPTDQNTALISLAGSTASVSLGLTASCDSCQRISKTLLGMELSDPDLESGDVADAMGEAANILAGQVKSIMNSVDSTLNICIPIFVRGQIDKAKAVESGVAKLHFGDIPVSIVVLLNAIKTAT